MRVHLIKRQSIEAFMVTHAGSRTSLQLWLSLLKQANWQSPADICRSFRTADLLGKGSCRVVFNIGGNSYRLIALYHFGLKAVHLYVKWIGTHADYSTLCAAQQQYFVNHYSTGS